MNKRPLIWLLLLMMLVTVTGCSQDPAPEPNTAAAFYAGKIIQLKDDRIFLAAADENAASADLCTVSLDGLTMTDEQNQPITAKDLTTGMIVAIGYDGAITETFPLGLSHPSTLEITQRADDIVGLYIDVINDLLTIDAGLNDGITQLVFDLTAVHNLTESEKSALIYISAQIFSLDTLFGTYDSLLADGYIDEQQGFTDGLLITLKDTAASDNRFTFDAQKWRSGDGAYYFLDCTAHKSDTRWIYEIGAEAIS